MAESNNTPNSAAPELQDKATARTGHPTEECADVGDRIDLRDHGPGHRVLQFRDALAKSEDDCVTQCHQPSAAEPDAD